MVVVRCRWQSVRRCKRAKYNVKSWVLSRYTSGVTFSADQRDRVNKRSRARFALYSSAFEDAKIIGFVVCSALGKGRRLRTSLSVGAYLACTRSWEQGKGGEKMRGDHETTSRCMWSRRRQVFQNCALWVP